VVINKQKLKNRVFAILRIIISAGILFFLFKTQFNNFAEVIYVFKRSNISYLYIILSFMMNLLVIYIMVLRWDILLRSQSILISKSFLLGSYLVGSFFNIFLPTSIGGDIYRIYDTAKLKNSSAIKASSIILMNRLTGLISTIIYLMAVIAFGFLKISRVEFIMVKWKISNQILVIILVIIFVLSFLLMLMMIFPDFFRLNRLFKKIKFLHRWEGKFKQAYETFKTFRKFKLILFMNILMSFMLQFIFTLTYYFAALSFGIKGLSLLSFIFIVQLISILTMIPISLGGIGVREGSFVILVGALGGARDVASIVSLVVLIILLIPGIAGSIIYSIRPAIDKKRLAQVRR
jgi:glycosyltransferase 2 family protein